MEENFLKISVRKMWTKTLQELNIQLFSELKYKIIKMYKFEVKYRHLWEIILPCHLKLIFQELDIKPNIALIINSSFYTRREHKFLSPDIVPKKIAIFSSSDIMLSEPTLFFCGICLNEYSLTQEICNCHVTYLHEEISSSNLRNIPIYNKIEYPIKYDKIRFKFLLLNYNTILVVLVDYKVAFKIVNNDLFINEEYNIPITVNHFPPGLRIFSILYEWRYRPVNVFRDTFKRVIDVLIENTDRIS
jgi:hypothetical protein